VLGYRAVQVLAYINQILGQEGRAPSYGMICDEFGIDRGNLHRLIVSLEKRGLLCRVGSGRVRRIRLS
jgi:DNA-binding MarR family transcriptional regulator